MNENRLLKRQTGTAKIFDVCYATDDPTFFPTNNASLATNISQQSLSSQSSSNGEEVSQSSEEDTSPDVTNATPNVIFTPKTPLLHEKLSDNISEEKELSSTTDKVKTSLSSKQNEFHAANAITVLIRKGKLENKRVTRLRLSKSFSSIQKPIIPKTFGYIGVGESYGDLASIVNNHSTERDIQFLHNKKEEFKRRSSIGIINDSLVKKSPFSQRLQSARSVSFSINSESNRKSSFPNGVRHQDYAGSYTNLAHTSSLSEMSKENFNASNHSLSSAGKAKIPLTFKQLNTDDKFLPVVAPDINIMNASTTETETDISTNLHCYTSTPMRKGYGSQTLPRNVTFDKLQPVTPISKDKCTENEKDDSIRRSISIPNNMNDSDNQNTTVNVTRNNSTLSNKSNRSFMDSFSSTKSWLAKKWSKAQRKKSKEKPHDGVQNNQGNSTLTTNKHTDSQTAETTGVAEPVISKDEAENRFCQPSLSTTEENIAYRSMSVDRTKDEDLSQTKPSIDTPLLVIINGEISITPSGKTDSPKLIRRRSSSLDNQLNGLSQINAAKKAVGIWKRKTEDAKFDRKSTTSSVCTMCGNPECKGLNGDADSVSRSSLCDRPCVYIGEGNSKFVSTLRLEIMENEAAASFNAPKSPLESNNNREAPIYKQKYASQRGNSNFPKQSISGNSLRPYKSGRNQGYSTIERAGKNMVSKHSRNNQVDKNMLTGVKAFNLDTKKGLVELSRFGFLDATNPEEIAYFLFHEGRLSKKQIGEFLGSPKDLNCQVLSFFVKKHMFEKLILVEALKQFLWSFRLPGEAQQIDRIMESFAAHYCSENPGIFEEQDTCYILSFSIIMLNTGLHNPNVKRKITVEEFVTQNRGINSGKDLPRDMLVLIYHNIKAEKFNIPEENYDDLMYTFFSPDKEGWLQKQGGSWKSWKRRWFLLSDRCLYYFQHTAEKLPKGVVPLENVNVRSIRDVDGHTFCFEVYNDSNVLVKGCKTDSKGTTVQGKHKSYKFSASTDEEKSDWIECIQASIVKHKFYDIVEAKKVALKRKSLRNTTDHDIPS